MTEIPAMTFIARCVQNSKPVRFIVVAPSLSRAAAMALTQQDQPAPWKVTIESLTLFSQHGVLIDSTILTALSGPGA